MINFLTKIELFFEGNKVETAIGKFLRKNKKTVATTESCTGGLVSSLMTDVSGSSEYIFANFVTYSNEANGAFTASARRLSATNVILL